MEMLIKIYDQDDNVLEMGRYNYHSINARKTDEYIVVDIPDKRFYISKKEVSERYSKYLDWNIFFYRLTKYIEEKKDFEAELIEEETDGENCIYPLNIEYI